MEFCLKEAEEGHNTTITTLSSVKNKHYKIIEKQSKTDNTDSHPMQKSSIHIFIIYTPTKTSLTWK